LISELKSDNNIGRELFTILAILIVCSSGQSQVGFWWWTWGNGSPPGGTNIGIAFSGWSNPQSALSDSSQRQPHLPGTKFISIGGGNNNGAWSSSQLNTLNSAISGGSFAGYGGIAYDIEEGAGGLGSLFAESFRLAKQRGLRVLVSISHSAPYGFPQADAAALMRQFFSDSNIDYISPQLYTSGTESQNDYTTSQGVGWDQYRNSRSPIVPSIVRGSYYSSALSYFRQNYQFNITGYVQWAN